jgi:hypothetical protein
MTDASGAAIPSDAVSILWGARDSVAGEVFLVNLEAESVNRCEGHNVQLNVRSGVQAGRTKFLACERILTATVADGAPLRQGRNLLMPVIVKGDPKDNRGGGAGSGPRGKLDVYRTKKGPFIRE